MDELGWREKKNGLKRKRGTWLHGKMKGKMNLEEVEKLNFKI